MPATLAATPALSLFLASETLAALRQIARNEGADIQ